MTHPQHGPGVADSYVDAIRAGEMFVDRTYQRELSEPRVRRMAEDFDRRLLGVLTVSDRGEGHQPRRYAIIDGQYRHAAAVEASPDGEDTPLVANVHEGLTVADEARLMYDIERTARPHTTWERWVARRTAGEKAVLDIEGIAAGHDLRFASSTDKGAITATGAAERLYARGGPGLLDGTLSVLRGAWGDDPAAYAAILLTAVADLIHGHGPDLDLDHLIEALTLHGSRPWDVRATANGYRAQPGNTAPLLQLVQRVITERYNRTARDAGVRRLTTSH
jgi:hypothetical protein